MRFIRAVLALSLCLLLSGAAGGNWLGESPPNYGEIRQYFDDPIFYSSPTNRFNEPYYPYFGEAFFRDTVQPIRLGNIRFLDTGNTTFNYPTGPYQSEFRNVSLAALQWDSFEKNWTATVEFVETRSSVRVFQDGVWRVVQL